jgi:dCMP deaminase
MTDWNNRFIGLAEMVASWSKDPSTKVGCVLVKNRKVVATGFNGFPPGIVDDERLHDRGTKYELIIHAEQNAILQAGRDAYGSTAYIHPLPPCCTCAKLLIAAGIKRIVYQNPESLPQRWWDEMRASERMLAEAGIEVVTL